MTVRELMELLDTMPQDAHVSFVDTWTRCEGWADGCESAVCYVDGAGLSEAGDEVTLFSEE